MNYETVVGLEIHCELNTQSKVFSRSSNLYNETPNINVNMIDMSFPGILPVLNEEALKKSIKMALALNCKIPNEVIFDRKNYYYPDLPKGYQITQNTKPIGVDGNIEIEVSGEYKNVLIHDIHLEEDTASLDHFPHATLIDYNRAGSPLIEIVTEPCIHSAEAAVAFLENIRNILKYLDVSEADTKKGQIRCDVNISLRDDKGNFLTEKVEIKNVNSFSSVYDAIKYEEVRQKEALEDKRFDELKQETRRFDDETGTTIVMREKVEGVDYKYFIDTNIPSFELKVDYINKIKEELPTLPNERKKEYVEKYNFSFKDASALSKEKEISDYFEECVKIGIDFNLASNWILTQIMGYLNKYELNINDFYLTPEYLKIIIDNINNKTISGKQAKDIFFKVLEEEKSPATFITKDTMQITDKKELRKIVEEIIANNENQVNEYKSGKTNLFDYFVGQVMKETRGKANPVITKDILDELLK